MIVGFIRNVSRRAMPTLCTGKTHNNAVQTSRTCTNQIQTRCLTFGPNLIGIAKNPTCGQEENNDKLLVPSPAVNFQPVRHKYTLKKPYHLKKYAKYKYSGWKRVHKFGLEARLATRSGKEILWNKIIRGDDVLTTCDRILEHDDPLVSNKKKKYMKQLPKKILMTKNVEDIK